MKRRLKVFMAIVSLTLAACGGGGGGTASEPAPSGGTDTSSITTPIKTTAVLKIGTQGLLVLEYHSMV